MKDPIPGSNKEESFEEFYNTEGKAKFGLKDLRFFFERLGKVFNIDGKLVNQQFAGTIDLSNDLTHYSNHIVITNDEILLAANPIIGGSAEIRMLGDGSHTPVFTAFVASNSDVYDNTLNAINKIVFYYDGTDAFYSNTVL